MGTHWAGAQRIERLRTTVRAAGRAAADWPTRHVVHSSLAPALAAVVLLAAGVNSCQAAPAICSKPGTNAIVCENARKGTPPSVWGVAGIGDPSIQGFATASSVARGSTIGFKVDTDAADYRLDIYRLGYYQGNGARFIVSLAPTAALPQTQPPCLRDDSIGLIDCGNWGLSASWTVPADAVSGIYLARLTRADTGGASHVPFVVRNDASRSALYLQASDTTWQAYNSYGGTSLYQGGPVGRGYAVSYNRPYDTRATSIDGRSYLFSNEYPMIRFLEANGYDVSYGAELDTELRGNLLTNHQAFLSVGHDEYWTGPQRANVEAARDAGVHLAFFSGNAVYWKARWAPSIADGAGGRTLISYKESAAGAKIDPSPTWTGTWRDPRFSPPSDGGRPENALTGTLWTVECCTSQIEVPAADGALRFWRNTPVAAQAPGGVATLAPGTLGYEWDEDIDNGARPPGAFGLSSTTRDVQYKVTGYGADHAPGRATHRLMQYRAPSGALVFGAGTVQWAWGLDADHDGASHQADPSIRQATVNLLADMGVQPTTLQAGLVAATASTDGTAPTAAFTAPAAGSTHDGISEVAVTGTAADVGGRVAGVEVSTDGGTTWHPADGRESWTYRWYPNDPGTVTLAARAVDDSGNLGPATTRSVQMTCPCSLLGARTPTVAATADTSDVTLGVRFRSDVAGTVSAIRYYRGPGNDGTHIVSLWRADGTLLATADAADDGVEGWHEVALPTPVALVPGTDYLASYRAPNGHYTADLDWFAVAPTDAPPLHAPRTGPTSGNGVFRAGAGFPYTTYRAANYWVDVRFEVTP